MISIRYTQSLRSLLAPTALFSLFVGCHHPVTSDPRLEPPLVQSTLVRPEAASLSRSFSGTVAARVQSDLGFRVGGKVQQRLVSSGERVHRGQLLMRLDSLDLQLAQNAQEEAVIAAGARARQATDDEARDRNLAAAGAEPASTYERVKAGAEAARAHWKAAEAQAKVARNATRYTQLVADVDGVVVETMAEPGQVVAPGQTVLRIAQHGPHEALVQLPETLRPAIGSSAQAKLYGRDGEAVVARLRELSSAADPRTRTFQARYVLEGALADAPFGATVTLILADDGSAHGVSVPVGAMHDPGSGAGVWTVAEEPPRVRWRPIEVGRIDDDTIGVKSGLALGDRVVSLGAHLLHDGQEVRLAARAGTP